MLLKYREIPMTVAYLNWLHTRRIQRNKIMIL